MVGAIHELPLPLIVNVMNSEQLDELGKFLIENIRDFNINAFDELCNPRITPFFGRKLGYGVPEGRGG
jgi:hypothetical protein